MAISDEDKSRLSPWQQNVAGLLALAFGSDGREVTVQAVVSWAEVLWDEKRLTPEDCYQAIKDHYREENRRIWPADLIKRCKVIRAKRAKEQEREQIVASNPEAVPMPEELRKRIGSLADKKTLD